MVNWNRLPQLVHSVSLAQYLMIVIAKDNIENLSFNKTGVL